jgi:ribonuclease T1
MRWLLPLLASLVMGIAHARAPQPTTDEVSVHTLPREARETLALIKRGGPFPYARDDTVFGNYERRLPVRPRGYYREYTVPTPGARDRGARRIVAGAGAVADVKSSNEYYYTADHYRSFKRIVE